MECRLSIEPALVFFADVRRKGDVMWWGRIGDKQRLPPRPAPHGQAGVLTHTAWAAAGNKAAQGGRQARKELWLPAAEAQSFSPGGAPSLTRPCTSLHSC